MKRDLEKDLHKLAKAFCDNLRIDNCEYGGIGVDSKRPFGNSDVVRDILEIIKLKPDKYGEYTGEQEDYADDLYKVHLIPYLQKIFKNK